MSLSKICILFPIVQLKPWFSQISYVTMLWSLNTIFFFSPTLNPLHLHEQLSNNNNNVRDDIVDLVKEWTLRT